MIKTNKMIKKEKKEMNENIKTVPNQKVITIHKEPTDKVNPENLYAEFSIEALDNAAVDLDGNCFKMWVYFAKNRNGYTFALSSKDANDSFGIKINAYNRAIKILQEKGYLVKQSGNYYKFYDVPLKD